MVLVAVMKKYTAKSLHPDASDLNHQAYKLGCTLFLSGDFDKAKAAFGEALAFWPKDAQAWMALGNCHDELNEAEAAERCFRRGLQYSGDKDRDAIRFNLANSLLDQERFDEAIKFYEAISPDSDVHTKAQRNLSLARAGVEGSRSETSEDKSK